MSTSPVTAKQEDLEGFPVLNSAVKQEYDESTVKFMVPLAAARNCLGTMPPCYISIKQETTHTSPVLHSAVKQEDVCVPQTEAFGETAVEDAGTSHRCSRVNDHELEQISRNIVMFARYPHKRPQQLIVEDDGSMLLSSLMDAWGDERQYSENIIIDAVQRHMYHEDTAEDLRFAILETEGSQSLRIKVRSARQGRALSCSQLNARAWTIATTIITEAAGEVWPDSACDIDVCRQSHRAYSWQEQFQSCDERGQNGKYQSKQLHILSRRTDKFRRAG